MTIQLIISPPARGKTRRCAELVCEYLGQDPLQTVWVVLPAWQQRRAFQQHLGDFGGVMGANLGTFASFNRAILAKANRLVPVIPNDALHRLVISVIDSVHQEGGLQHYGSLRAAPGFIQMLKEYFAELKRALVYPDDFLSGFGQDASLGEIGRLYLAYQARLKDLDRADPEGVGWLAVEVLETDPKLLKDWGMVVIDGFDSFTPVQKRILELIRGQVDRMVVTLPGEKQSSRVIHRRFLEVQREIIAKLGAEAEWLASDHLSLPPVVAHLEANLSVPGAVRAEFDSGVTLLEARSPAEESREAVRWIKSQIVRGGFSLRDCAIATPNPEIYQAALKSAAAEYGVPLHFTFLSRLSDHPASTALLDVLSLTSKNYSNRLVINCIRSPYLNFSAWGLTRQGATSLDLVVHFGQIIEGVSQWENALNKLAAVQDEDMRLQEDEENPSLQLPYGSRAADLWSSLKLLFDDMRPPEGRLGLSDWVTWLEDLMDRVGFCTGSEYKEDGEVLHLIRKVLRNLVLSVMITGDEMLSFDQFIADLTGALEGAGGENPEKVGGNFIVVMRLIEARGVRFRALAFLGLSESIFPKPERPDPFFSEAVRRELQMDPRIGREQVGLFYQAITRADDQLLLTRPYLAENGEPWEPSPYWNAVAALIPEGAVQRIRPDAFLPLEDAASLPELLFHTARRAAAQSTGLPKAFQAVMDDDLTKLTHSHSVLAARCALRPSGSHEGHLIALKREVHGIFFENAIWSASRLEAYRICPHNFWVRYGLKLEEHSQPQPGLDVSQLGLILHEVLEKSYQAVDDPGNSEEVKAAMRSIAAEVFAEAPEQYSFRPTILWEIEQDEMLANLDQSIDALNELAPGWTPYAHELAFGTHEQPPLVLEAEGGTIHLKGFVDRVDRNDLDQYRVIDYKTGAGHQGKQDLIKGRRLQLPLYALAVQEARQLGEVIDGFYWSINSAKQGGLVLSRFESEAGGGVSGAIAVAQEHITEILDGVREVQFIPEPLDGDCYPYCPAKSWCWRYSPGR